MGKRHPSIHHIHRLDASPQGRYQKNIGKEDEVVGGGGWVVEGGTTTATTTATTRAATTVAEIRI